MWNFDTFLGIGGTVGAMIGVILGLMLYFDVSQEYYWMLAGVLAIGGCADVAASYALSHDEKPDPVMPQA